MAGKNNQVIKTLLYFTRKGECLFAVPVGRKLKKLKEELALQELKKTVQSDIHDKIASLVEAGSSAAKDYIAIGSLLVAKKLLYILGFLLPVIAIAVKVWCVPFITSKFLTKTMEINSPEMYQYTGKVRLLAPGTNHTIFLGRLSEGRIIGYGRLFDNSGHPVYEGDFEMEMYSGNGQTYYPNGTVNFKGGFAMNNYQGFGYLYDENGSPIYTGDFAAGLYEGEGKLYDTTGNLIYEGEFLSGKKNGKGILYDSVTGEITGQGIFRNDILVTPENPETKEPASEIAPSKEAATTSPPVGATTGGINLLP